MAEDTDQKNPFTRPGFIFAAVVLAIIVVLGIVAGIINATKSDSKIQSSQSSQPESNAVPTGAESAIASSTSVCGLPGEVMSGSVSTPPAAEWEYQGTTIAYPTSSEAGPGVTNGGVRTCFQHSPEGALFAAANAVVQGADQSTVEAWADYFMTGPARDQLFAANFDSATDSSTYSGIRMGIAGFRVLDYDGNSARIDIAVRGSESGETFIISMIYSLVWESGDWKLNITDANAPIDVAAIPDLAGYVTWRA